jgi:hypothetical protein
MNRLELTKQLAAAGISDKAVTFSFANDKYCLIQRGADWVVLFNERGVETYFRKFQTEDEACAHVFDLLSKSGGYHLR